MTDIDGMVKAEALLARNHGRSAFTGLVWDGSGDGPEPGDTVWTSDLRCPSWTEDSTHIEIGSTLWGDYCGSDIGRSNCRSLLRDYPDVFVSVTAVYSTEYLVLNVDQSIPTDLFETLVRLADDYPVYDESDHAELISDLAEEAWDDYLDYAVPSDLVDLGITDDQLETIAPSDLRDEFYRLTYSMPEYPYGESAVNVAFPCMDDTLAALAAWVRERVKAAEVDAIMELLKPGA